jgi:hypothetical protein
MLTGESSVHVPVAENYETQRDQQGYRHSPLTERNPWSSSSIAILDEDDNVGNKQSVYSSLSIVRNHIQTNQDASSGQSIDVPFVNHG